LTHVGEEVDGPAKVSAVNAKSLCHGKRCLGFIMSQIDVYHCIEDVAIGDRIRYFFLGLSCDQVFLLINDQELVDRKISFF